MPSVIEVIEPAEDISLISLYEARLGLNMSSSTEMVDDQLEMMIRWASDEVATMCNRIFAKETVKETIREVDTTCHRLYLSHFPVIKITSVTEDGDETPSDEYELDVKAGMINRTKGFWTEPVVISYSGGYELPIDAPPALQQAAVLMTREAYNAAIRGDATTRMVAHKEARVIYFDPNAKGALGSSGTSLSGSPARRAVSDLLKKFTRFWV